jgi:hypothetical protein
MQDGANRQRMTSAAFQMLPTQKRLTNLPKKAKTSLRCALHSATSYTSRMCFCSREQEVQIYTCLEFDNNKNSLTHSFCLVPDKASHLAGLPTFMECSSSKVVSLDVTRTSTLCFCFVVTQSTTHSRSCWSQT